MMQEAEAQAVSRSPAINGEESEANVAHALDRINLELVRLREEIAGLRGHNQHSMAAWRGVLPRLVTIRADQVASQQGFHALEQTEAGTSFCWTGPANRFFFEILIDRTGGADLLLHAINFIDFEQQSAVTLIVDGEPVPVSVDKGGMGIVIHAVLPPRRGGAPTQAVFVVPEMLSPDDPSDTRSLGLAFVRLTVTARG